MSFLHILPVLKEILLMADPENQQGDRRRPSFSEITPEHLSKELSDLMPPLKINYKDPSEVIRSLSLEMRDAINQTLKFADGLSDTQKKTFRGGRVRRSYRYFQP